MIGEI